MLVLRGLIPRKLGSAGSDTPQDLVLRGLVPHRILFCGVSDPTGKLRPRRIRQKSIKSLPFSLKGYFSKIVCMYKLHYPRLIVSCLKSLLSWKWFFVLRGMIPRRTSFEFEYLGEFEIEIKNILEHESRVHMGLIHLKNQRPKISCYCTINLANIMLDNFMMDL